MADVVLDCALLERSGMAILEYSALSTEDRYLALNNGRMGVFVTTGVKPTLMSFHIPQELDGQNVYPREVLVPPNSIYGIGSWPTGVYNNASAQMAFTLTVVHEVKLFCAMFV